MKMTSQQVIAACLKREAGAAPIMGFDACLYDVLRDVVYEDGGIIFPSPKDAAEYAIKLAAWSGADKWDAAVRTVYHNGIRERIFESCESLATGAQP